MSRDKVLLIGVDLGNEKDCQCATLNLYYNGIDHIIYQTTDKEQVAVFNEVLEDVNKEKTKLKHLESIDNAEPSEALEKLYELENIDLYMSSAEDDEENDFISLEIFYWLNPIEQSLLKAQEQEKVLSIINEKNVDIVYLKDSNNVEEYNSHFGAVVCKLTQEEYELLKRYFK